MDKTSFEKKGQSARPKSRNRHAQHGQNSPNRKKQIFEPHWSSSAVADGMKSGVLFSGPLRINQKNYEDAYVPQPDGKNDVYIQGMTDRNRAFDRDEVVLLPLDCRNWKVFTEEFEAFEKKHTALANSTDANDDDDSYDSGPDVVIESDSDDDAKTKDTKDTPDDHLEKSMKELKLSEDAVCTQSKPIDIKQSLKPKQPAPRGSGGSSSNKFVTVWDMVTNGSDFAKSYFTNFLNTGFNEENRKLVQVTAKVVAIYERKNSMAASGHLRLLPDKNKNFALFSPSDSRIPRMMIPMPECPKGFAERPEDFSRTLFIGRVKHWDDNSKMPKGTLCRSLGEAGQIQPETEALLIEMDVDDRPFSKEVEACLPQNLPFVIPDHEYQSRLDLRNKCVFTIDPATARDLDDAVSMELLPDGRYSLGVHIADVSYFIEEHSALDKVASERATSVYLVQKVIPMLPRLLCEELCSLNPNQDRLTFSVIWILNEKGEIYDEWYGRSVIKSCVKLSYDHAQGFIDHPEREWTTEELPPITNGFSWSDIRDKVLLMHKISSSLRKQRFDNGALRLDQVKLQYNLDADTGMPNGYSVYQQRDSNRLIEEFMLLANMAVAHKIKHTFPELAILRRHPEPQQKPLEAVETICHDIGMFLDVSSALSIQKSLHSLGDSDDEMAKLQVLTVLLSKPMQNAKYFCTGVLQDERMFHHYALNVPLYTHFTSPIRRYPDVLVHRLLAASLGYAAPTTRSKEALQKQAEHCNDKKTNAKTASDRSNEMFFSLFVKEAGTLEEEGMVMAVLDKAFDVQILKLGVSKRVYLDKLPLVSSKFRKNRKLPELDLVWKADEHCSRETVHRISLFSKVKCVIHDEPEPLRWSCVIRRPEKEVTFISSEDS